MNVHILQNKKLKERSFLKFPKFMLLVWKLYYVTITKQKYLDEIGKINVMWQHDNFAGKLPIQCFQF